jgi:hypothetical protein
MQDAMPPNIGLFDVELNMEVAKEYEGPERRAYPRFPMPFPASLRLSVIREGNPTVLEFDGETVDVSLVGARILLPQKPEIASFIEDANEGRGVDVGVEIVTKNKRIKAVGDVRWFKAEAPEGATVGIHLTGMGRDDREIWEDLVKSVALSLQGTGGIKHYSSDIFTELDIQRIRRKTWMRLIPTSRHYECKYCHCKFLRIFGLFSLVRAPGTTKLPSP